MNFPNWIKRFALWYVWFSFLLIGCDSEPQAARKLYQVEEAQSDIRAVAFSPDNQAFAFITVDNQVQLRNLSKNEILQTFSYNEIDQLASLTFSNDSTQLAVSTETLVDVWDIEKNQLLKSFLVDDLFQGGGTLAFSPDGSHLALNAGDTLRIWDIQNDEIVTDVEVLHYAYYPGNIAFSPRGNLIAIFTGVLQIWSLESEELVAYIPYEYGSDSFSFTTDGMELVSTKRNEVFRWRMPHGELIDNFTIKDRALLAVLPPDAKEVVEFSAERTSSNEETPPHQRIDIYISLWRVDDKEMLWRIPANDLELNEMGYIVTSPEGDYLAMIGISNGFDIWEIKE